MKAILISIRPEWVAKILKGEKSIEIRKTAPKCDLPIQVYIYCTKGGVAIEKDCGLGFPEPINGKVVASFTLEEITVFTKRKIEDGLAKFDGDLPTLASICDGACLTWAELYSYSKLGNNYAYHISDLEIFDEPKEISEFRYWACLDRVKQVPQSWFYVEELK